ncbi:hypothetical protein [Mesorhizobium sp.]|uniref:hypothetical protein n=1 Tax=Mesorhizobium sp. TaxID=1871066 RepID=UPI000FE36097|nr:hypothetical protein [Mesorhizobium sp.]RWH74484.1 MAG: hypothetical protein EOQ84_04790 [Mesorhizobium sp.]RWL25331.1 MAG: hypothetical protein EOR58_20315 [Mesorhizobium sp.]RWL34910.1 MAG: hypothetical protein EOR63_05615 [Mesorhizobium sp.]RWL36931.1 MAG: hypothetical protein EOR59_20270 [Mesorhizobium sp.]RWL54675.1 MAG: hypothetical protein EOR61_14110 [Mesorhizobium sp.]
MTEDNPIAIQERDFLASLGALIVEYNGAENAFRNLLASAATAKPVSLEAIALAQILTVEMGNVALSQAMQSYASDIAPAEMEQPLKDAAKYLDTIREHRNFYVHGISVVLTFSDAGTLGQIYSMTAKSALKEHRTAIAKSDLDALQNHCKLAKQFFRDLMFRLDYLQGHWHDEFEPPLPGTPPALDRLSKPARHWKEYFPRRQPSRE